ncbi:MAG: YqaE/Pmp3 family membrane protein [Nonlabens sp.]
MGILTIILNIFLPPLSVLLNRGVGKDLLINIILTILGIIPGIIHAFYVTK